MTTEIKHVVALSGGKDSSAMALRLAEVEPRPYIYVCTPTGNEPPEKATGHTFRSEGRDTWPASMEGLRGEFEKGRVPRETRKDQFGELRCRVCRL